MNTPSLLVPLVMIWLGIGVITAWVAARKKKPIFEWFLAGALFGPLVLLALLLPARVNPALPAKWSYLILVVAVGGVLWLGWITLYGN